MSYRFLIVNTDYGHFLDGLYQNNPELADKSYEEQYAARKRTLFGMNDFYSTNLQKLGHEAVDVICNNPYLQCAWAIEKGLLSPDSTKKNQFFSDKLLIALFTARVKMYKPDVIINLAMESITSEVLKPLKKEVPLIIGQHAATITPSMSDLSVYDLIVSSLPNYVEHFKSLGKKSAYFKLGFESTVLDRVRIPCEKSIDISFVGSFSGVHAIDKDVFNYLAGHGFNMSLYGYNDSALSAEARRFFHGPVYGRDMYQVYANSKIVINRHALSYAGEYANNMRLYESTGMGAMLITDARRNLGEIFEVGNEVAAYQSPEQCAKLVKHYLEHEDQRQRIAKKGQQRTLSEHSYSHRMEELVEIVDRHLGKSKTCIEPVSRKFGLDRGTPIDRYYIEKFLSENRESIRGRVLEIAGNAYTCKFGSSVTQSEILNTTKTPATTIVGDLTKAETIPESAFDCIILTQTVQFIYDLKTALRNAVRALKPGGTLLLTASGISQISRYDMDRWGEYWRFTDKCLKRLLSEYVPEQAVSVEVWGNVAVAKAYLDGLSVEELDKQTLEHRDNDYQVILTVRVCKPAVQQIKTFDTVILPIQEPILKNPLVLLYHRVADDPLDSQLLTVSPNNFEGQLRELKEKYRVIPLFELIEEVRKGQQNTDTVAITFDDGYLDNLTNGLPLLEKYQLPATIFVTSEMVGSDGEFWWDAMERIFLTGRKLPGELSIQGSQEVFSWPLNTEQERLKGYDELCELLRGVPVVKISEIIDKLFLWAGITGPGRMSHRVVDSDQLRRLADSSLIEIGSHSLSHTYLRILSPQEQRREISESKCQLESTINKPVRLISYPYGAKASFTDETKRITAQAGYKAGFANIRGSVTAEVDMYAVPRRRVRNWEPDVFARWLSSEDEGKDNLEIETISDRADKIASYQRSCKPELLRPMRQT
ncbi:MAG: polysaccharide deacetylase family protein [Planctomycetes bacterium]|nr:polysaccharide deacetylase family protein [Planctomycetota bacterium]